jgi:hypothetical protein
MAAPRCGSASGLRDVEPMGRYESSPGGLVWFGVCLWSMGTLLAAANHRWPAALASGALACATIFALVKIQNRTSPRLAGPWPTATCLCLVGIALAVAGAWNVVQIVHLANGNPGKEGASLVLFAVGTVLAVGGAYSAWLWTGKDEAR